jgi:hypothetical protein
VTRGTSLRSDHHWSTPRQRCDQKAPTRPTHPAAIWDAHHPASIGTFRSVRRNDPSAWRR